jgi:hypothetical protein
MASASHWALSPEPPADELSPPRLRVASLPSGAAKEVQGLAITAEVLFLKASELQPRRQTMRALSKS